MADIKPEDLIRKYFQRWLGIPGHTLGMLADISRVPYSTVHRVSLGASVPKTDVFLAISEVICSRAETLEVLDMVAPATAARMRSWLPFGSAHQDGQRNYVCDDRYLLSVYLLSTRRNGTSHGEIKEIYGSKGIDHLQRLLSDSLVHIKEGRLFASDRSVVFNEYFNAKAILELNAMCPETCSDNLSAVRLWVIENLNESCIEKLTRKIRDLEKDIRDELCNPQNVGDLTWIFTMVSNGSTNIGNDQEAQ